ncbi:hypothetical protein Ccar_10840 [Clostridium carboxidivorans P7]|uniref:SnoaL-like domain-containing protein n=1 Tax=Clostridium carboxidivorans P7 TaxID=536227 RepID=C6PZ05_9CLOT|nr:hypothetical protein [Clostridium carboxidivorans]AKN31324.1 hypothetical protein Ccar_10840 [Clostridium carboxidivorans P7]EET85539.1 hypothetical protein CcarbDRAFT_4022 [Clostridium carboxidivorans P7]EFG88454.1 hypothetical protein CLCAR_2032 [Clostridium carboxidivorans P7]
MKTLPIGASDEEIKNLVIEWNELLAAEKYEEALSMFLSDNLEVKWTPELLEQAVYGYGVVGYTREEIKEMFGPEDYKITSIFDNKEKDKIINSIEVSHDWNFKDESTIGMVHYDCVPLNGELSDLTARFYIRKIYENNITLEFLDLHVM